MRSQSSGDRQREKPFWTARTRSRDYGNFYAIESLLKSTVHRIWQVFGLDPHRQKHFKLSTDPFFAGKVYGILGYCRAVRESHGKCGGFLRGRKEPDSGTGTHAADVADGTWLRAGRDPRLLTLRDYDAVCRTGHGEGQSASGISGFPKRDRKERSGDIGCAHHRGQLCHAQHPRVKRWLAVRPRFHMHFTPTYASRLNQVEIWFNRITQQAIRRGTFRSVKELIEKIDQSVQTSNNHAKPSSGPPRIRSSLKCNDYVNVFPGRDTSN
jgi:putative transposase